MAVAAAVLTLGSLSIKPNVESITNLYIGSSAEAYTSLVVLGPFITTSLGPTPTRTIQSSARQTVTCFSGIAGTIDIFDFTSDEAGPAMGAPDNAVRYVLYGMDGMSKPDVADSIGFIEVHCLILSDTSKAVGMSIVANGV